MASEAECECECECDFECETGRESEGDCRLALLVVVCIVPFSLSQDPVPPNFCRRTTAFSTSHRPANRYVNRSAIYPLR